ncbi:actin cytoskeleton-regulatory complex protein PAN1-like isoform X3 [Hermetia illucens]|uniref:actin cytoskeleton-regulatory complex protein PAN1-like isoform X3 n=1 Tax=Hermetia illucens TaxID=343691 RepID=UPI0018CC3011|nr:actin cytoskeleton-regulatory complex protein PAN1-like isoform X3 [Hermetia illucens]
MMDWSRCSKVYSTRRSSKRKTLLTLSLATYAVLLCLIPLVVARNIGTDNGDADGVAFGPPGLEDVFSDSEVHHLSHHKRHHHSNNRIDNEDSINSVKDWTANRKRKLRDRNVQKHTEEDNEYEKISSPSVIAAKAKGASKTNLKYLEPDKKFFDYFPIEDVELNYDPKEDDIRVVLLSDDDDTDGKKKKSKKFTASTLMKKTHPHQRQKRDVQYPGSQDESATSADGEGGKITKRNVFPQYLSSNSIPGADCNYIPQSSPNFPWFPRPSRFYLPVVYVPVPVFQGYVPSYPFYHNPALSYPGYLPPPCSPPTACAPPTNPPPAPVVPTMPSGNKTNLADRFGNDDYPIVYPEDDRVIWDASPARDQTVSSFDQPSPPAAALPFPTTTQRPATVSTRRPPPPLIHRPDRPEKPIVRRTSTTRPTTGIFDSSASNALGGGFRSSFGAQPARRPTPPPPPPPTQDPETPSRCIWAIVSCCSRNDLAVRYACFEQLGCHGAFWDRNPCADKVQDAALEETSRFFDRK